MFATATPWVGLCPIGLILWIAIAFWPARFAACQGDNFRGFFLLSPLPRLPADLAADRA